MLNYKQVPLVRVAARKALEENRISLHEYNSILKQCEAAEKQRIADRKLESKAAATEWMSSKSNIHHLQAL